MVTVACKGPRIARPKRLSMVKLKRIQNRIAHREQNSRRFNSRHLESSGAKIQDFDLYGWI